MRKQLLTMFVSLLVLVVAVAAAAQTTNQLDRVNVIRGTDDIRIEMSSSEEAAGIHKLTAVTDAFVAPGKPTLVASLDDPASHKRYQVSVTATKVR